jgi:hypothetical protein
MFGRDGRCVDGRLQAASIDRDEPDQALEFETEAEVETEPSVETEADD